jgi:hypothetical protein
MKLTLKAPGIKLLKLKYGKPISNFGIKFNLRLYTKDIRTSSGTFLSRQQDPAGAGPGGCCLLRHPTHLEPSCIESYAVLLL